MYALVSALLVIASMYDELVHDPVVRAALWELMEATRFGFAETEEAMFIVRGGNGRLSFLRWTSTHLRHQARWTGPLPYGVVAIAHTHPNWLPDPSRTDVRTATRSNIPIYVVTRTRITKTNGGKTRRIVTGEWRPRKAKPSFHDARAGGNMRQ